MKTVKTLSITLLTALSFVSVPASAMLRPALRFVTNPAVYRAATRALAVGSIDGQPPCPHESIPQEEAKPKKPKLEDGLNEPSLSDQLTKALEAQNGHLEDALLASRQLTRRGSLATFFATGMCTCGSALPLLVHANAHTDTTTAVSFALLMSIWGTRLSATSAFRKWQIMKESMSRTGEIAKLRSKEKQEQDEDTQKRPTTEQTTEEDKHNLLVCRSMQ